MADYKYVFAGQSRPTDPFHTAAQRFEDARIFAQVNMLDLHPRPHFAVALTLNWP